MAHWSLPSWSGLQRAILKRARIDTRALAAFRVFVGSILLVDLALRSRSLGTFYTDSGIVTRQVLGELYPFHPDISIHALSGDVWFQIALFVLAGIAAVALTAGYRTRVATVVSFILLVSLHARNPTVLNSGDVLLRRLLFFSIFLPLGARWSVDAVGSDDAPGTVTTLASLALLLQVVLVYLVNASFKLESQLWLQGEAVRYVLSLDRFNVLFGSLVSGIQPLAAGLNWVWVALIFSSWLLIVTTRRHRSVLAGLFIALHAGMMLTIDLSVFPLVSIASLVPFLHGGVWDRIEELSWPRFVRRVVNWAPAPTTTGPSVGSATIQRIRPVVNASVLALLLISSAMGVGIVPAPDGAPEKLSETSWTMFAQPPTLHSWIVAEGQFASGRTTDLLRDRPVRLDRPPDTSRYPNARWRKHLSRYPDSASLPAAYADYQCHRWNEEPSAELVEVRIVWAWTSVDGADERASTSELGRFRCTETGATPVDRNDDQ